MAGGQSRDVLAMKNRYTQKRHARNVIISSVTKNTSLLTKK